jgi:hypothetical protein
MSCRIDLADLFGDETIEVVDLGCKEKNSNLDTTIECPVPPMCADICPQKIAADPDDESHQVGETEAGYDLDERVLPESSDPSIDETCSALQSQNDATMCSPMMIQHVDQKAQAEIRKVELEELRQLSLAKQNGKCISVACSC